MQPQEKPGVPFPLTVGRNGWLVGKELRLKYSPRVTWVSSRAESWG